MFIFFFFPNSGHGALAPLEPYFDFLPARDAVRLHHPYTKYIHNESNKFKSIIIKVVGSEKQESDLLFTFSAYLKYKNPYTGIT